MDIHLKKPDDTTQSTSTKTFMEKRSAVLFVICCFFSKLTFSKNYFRNTISVSNSLDPDPTLCMLGIFSILLSAFFSKLSSLKIYKEFSNSLDADPIFACWVIFQNLLSSAVFCVFFFKIMFFEKILSGLPLQCQTVWIQIRPDKMSGLIWVQTVCKGYQQTTKSVTDSKRAKKLGREKVKLFISLTGIHQVTTSYLK